MMLHFIVLIIVVFSKFDDKIIIYLKLRKVMKKKMALDVDGVLLEFMPAFDKAAEICLNRTITPQKDEDKMDFYHLGKRVNATQDEVDVILEYMQTSRMYANLKAFDGAREAVAQIEQADFSIYIVTALPEKARDMRLENLEKALGLIPTDIYCVGMGKSKADALHELRPDVFIDDRVDYLSCAPSSVYHLALIDQKEAQKNKDFGYDAHVHSLAEWTEKHLARVTKKLDRYYEQNLPLQMDIRLQSVSRMYPKK